MDLEEMQELQEIDLRRDDAKRQLQMIADQIAEHPYLEALDGEIEAQTQASAQAAGAQREAGAAVETAQRRIEVADKRLYGGGESNPRVLEDLERDLYAQRQHLVTLRDTELAARNQADEATDGERWLTELRERSLGLWNKQQAELRELRDEAEQRVASLTAQAEQQRGRLVEADLRIYDEYRQRRPRVVTEVAGGVCGECRLVLPTMVITRARRGGAPIECPSCGCLVRVA